VSGNAAVNIDTHHQYTRR